MPDPIPRRWSSGVCLLCLIVAVGTSSLCPGAARAAPPRAAAAEGISRVSATIPVAGWLDKLWNKIENNMNNERGVIQLGLIGMLIALWIIWWRR